jgi:thiol-disulfide isomerase/thioredoxin
MRPTAERIALILLLVLAFAGVTSSAEPVRQPAPDFTCDSWLNSRPLNLADLRGRVVLIDFWEYTCINCIRTFPYLRRWNALYGPLGLTVIGVHTPEFAFARDPKRVAEAAKRFGLTFPIAVDGGYQVWNAFHNEAWPAKYLIDKNGNIAFTHIGEGDYAEFERHIQELLKEADPQLNFAGARFAPPRDGLVSGCAPATPETYLGFARGERLANAGGYQSFKPAAYQAPAAIPLDGYALSGKWLATPESLSLTDGDAAKGASLTLHYRAKSVYLVAGSDDGSNRPLYLAQDGKALTQGVHGVDVRADAAGRTYVELSGKRMYYLIENPGFAEHTIKLTAGAPGFSLYSFTFGNNCENAFDHR